MALDLTAFDAGLKLLYTDQHLENLVYKNRPFLAMIPKDEEFYGKSKPLPCLYGNPQGRSTTFSTAQTGGASGSSKLALFNLTRVRDYGVVTIDNETMYASSKDVGAFLDAKSVEIDGIINSLSNSLATAMFREGYGAIGSIATSSFGVTTLALNQIEDISNFEVGMQLVVAASVSSNTLRALGSSGNGLIITGVNRNAGTLTFGFNVNDATNGIPTIAQNDFLFAVGDRQNSATPAITKVAGLAAWLPYTAPSPGESFYGVDRTKDVSRLAGQRFDGSTIPVEEAVIEAASLVAREDGTPDHLFMHYHKYADLEKALGSRVQYTDFKVGEIGFKGMTIHGPNSDINVIPDRNCPYNRGYMLELDTWALCSLGKAPRVLDTDSLQMLRQSNADGVEVRYGYYANVYSSRPGANCVINW